jgi:hypothetical protein
VSVFPPEPILLTAHQIHNARADAVAAGVVPHRIDEMQRPLLAAAEGFEASGSEVEASVLLLLSGIAGFFLNLDEPKAPLRSAGHFDTVRFVGPEDLSDEHLEMLAAIRDQLTDSELVARISDLLWQRRKNRDIADARTALSAYLTAAKEHEVDDQWPHPFRRLQRAHQLARIFRPGSVEYATVDEYAMDLIGRLGDAHDSFHVEALADLLLEAERTPAESAAIAGQAERLARSIEEAEPMRARRYYAVAAKWYRRLKQDDDVARVDLAGAETYVTEALTREPMVRGMLLGNAVIALRNAKAPAERVLDVRRMQAEAAEAGVREMKVVQGEIDISDIVAKSQSRARGLAPERALLNLALGTGIAKVADLRKTVEEQMQVAPLRHLFASTTVDARGRVLGFHGAALSKDPAEAEKAITAQMARQSMLQQQLIVRGFVRPFLDVLLTEHRIDLRELVDFVTDRPFVPKGRELMFARGLLYGFEDDFSSAAAVLVPQVEHALRTLLVHAGELPYKQDAAGVQDFWDLNRVLHHATLEAVLGSDQVFDLRSLLVSRFGANLRNNVAHGLVSFETLKGDFSIYLWWRTMALIAAIDFLDQNEETEIDPVADAASAVELPEENVS